MVHDGSKTQRRNPVSSVARVVLALLLVVLLLPSTAFSAVAYGENEDAAETSDVEQIQLDATDADAAKEAQGSETDNTESADAENNEGNADTSFTEASAEETSVDAAVIAETEDEETSAATNTYTIYYSTTGSFTAEAGSTLDMSKLPSMPETVTYDPGDGGGAVTGTFVGWTTTSSDCTMFGVIDFCYTTVDGVNCYQNLICAPDSCWYSFYFNQYEIVNASTVINHSMFIAPVYSLPLYHVGVVAATTDGNLLGNSSYYYARTGTVPSSIVSSSDIQKAATYDGSSEGLKFVGWTTSDKLNISYKTNNMYSYASISNNTSTYTASPDLSVPISGDRYYVAVFAFASESASSSSAANSGSTSDSNLAVSGSTGISASGSLSGKNIPDGAEIEISAKVITSGSIYDALLKAMGSGVNGGVFEVNLSVNGNIIHDEFGNLILTFPVDSAYNGHWITVYHYHNDGTITSERVVAKDGKVTITVTDLSTFALELGEVVSSGNVSALADTGDETSTAPLVVTAIAALLMVCIACRCMLARPRGKHVRD